jgi:sugar lactone lactonase YvrE
MITRQLRLLFVLVLACRFAPALGAWRSALGPAKAEPSGTQQVPSPPSAERQAPSAAPPLLGPDEALTVDQIRPGMHGVGKSVFQGTRIETFKITVLGVLRKIDFGGDMILIRVESGPVVSRGQGVSAGMSGSPIYVDGKLIGALAYAWPFSKDPLAGVTPIHQMLEAFEPGSSGPRATGTLAPAGKPLAIGGKTITRVSVVPEAAPGQSAPPQTLMLAPVATPLFVSGMGKLGLDYVQRRLGRYNLVAMPGPGRVETTEKPALVPGAAVGAQLVAGDVDITAVGTVTFVKGDRVIAFGHPMFGLGAIDVPMTTAYVHGVISSSQVSFKMASPVDMVGKVSQDRNWSIGGRLGEHSSLIPARFQIRDLDRGVSRQYSISTIRQKELTSSLIYGSLMNAIASVAPPEEGTTRSTLEVTAQGLPAIRRENVFVSGGRSSAFEQLFADPFAAFPMGELLEVLETLQNNPFGPIPVAGVKVDVEVTQARQSAAIERVYADRKRVKPGEKVKLGVVIQPYNREKEVREIEVEIPRGIPGGRVQIGVAGGLSAKRALGWLGLQRPTPRTVPQLLAAVTERERNNDLVVETTLPVAGISASGREFPDIPNSLAELLLSASPTGVRLARGHQRQLFPTPWSLSGGQIVSLLVETDERDKVGPAPTPSIFPGLPGFGTLFEELLRSGSADAPTTGDDDTGDDSSDDTDVAWLAPGGSIHRGGAEDAEKRLEELFSALPLRPLRLRGETGFEAAAPNRGAARSDPGELQPPKMPTWEELDDLAQKDVSDLTIQDLTASGGGGRRGIARAASVWMQSSQKEFATGKVEGAIITSAGEVVAAPTPVRLHDSADHFLLGQAADRHGNVYVGGWLDGTVTRIDPQGRVSRFFDTGDVAVQALAVDAEDNLYVGALPGGQITRLRPDGTATPLCQLRNSYIWGLQCGPGGTLYAATGSEGKLYRISPDGTAEVVFSAPDRHILALATPPEGAGNAASDWRLYFGTYPKGKVYRLDAAGHVTPVFETPRAAVQSLALDRAGNLYVGTSPKAAIYKVTPDGAVTTLFQSTERHVMSLAAGPDGMLYAAVGPMGKVYRIAPDKTVATLFDPQTSYALSLTRDSASSLLVTTAGPSRVYRLALTATESTGPGAGSREPGAATGGSEGTYVSAVRDAGGPARWGVIRWNTAAHGGPVRLETRSGNTAYPDATWSDWSPEYTQAGGQPITSPPGQFIQYRALLGPSSAAPTTLQSVELYYMTRNRAPVVTLAAPAGNEVWSGQKSVQWSAKDPDRDRLTYEVFYAADGTTAWKKLGTKTKAKTSALEMQLKQMDPGDGAAPGAHPTPMKAAPGAKGAQLLSPQRLAKIRLHLRRSASSADQITLPAPSPGVSAANTPLRRKQTAQAPKRAAGAPAAAEADKADAADADATADATSDETDATGEAQSTDMAWNTKEVPDGRYRLKVVASDALANPTEPLTAEAISDTVVVDNTPPRILTRAAKRAGAGPPAEIPCRDALTPIASAEYRVDQGEWIAAAAADGIFDSLAESVRIDPSRLPKGKHSLTLRVRDAAGNERAATMSYER